MHQEKDMMFTSLNHLKNEFVVIAGPCVIEDDNGEITRQTAKHLKTVAERLNLKIYFKSSYDKANRSSIKAYRGPGLKKGLQILESVREDFGLPLLTDVHSPEEAREAGKVIDMLQIPAFLSRQTDILVAAGETGRRVNIKKGQFLSPKDVIHCAEKVKSTGNEQIFITERGSSFGYNNLVVDMRSIPIIQGMGLPLIFDATHSVQLPGGAGDASTGERQYAPILARAAVAAGCSGLFMETHPHPDSAPSDGPNMVPLEWIEPLLTTCLELREVLRKGELVAP
jgi:2-dehydro-3-deoxyphosphooctonate aldolase (KDO 8-P synthase)